MGYCVLWYRNPIPEDMVTISSINLSDYKDMYREISMGLEETYQNVICDDACYTIWIVWDDEK